MTDTPNKEDYKGDDKEGFNSLAESLKGLPATWYPALLAILVEESYSCNVWRPGGASHRISRIEEKIGKAKPDGEEET